MRLFLLDESGAAPVRPGVVVALGAAETHHLVRVLRVSVGAAVALADGQGRFVDGELVGVRDGRAEVIVRAVRDDPWERQGPRLELACGLVKGPRFAWALEKAVELGAHAIRPLLAARAVVVPGEGRLVRWEAVVRAATKQAGRSLVPTVHAAADLAACLADLPAARLYYGEEAARRSPEGGASGRHGMPLGMAELLAAGAADAATLVWLVGPEGGWSTEERAALAAGGAVPVRLGPHRLRTETAVVAGLVLLQALREFGSGPP